MLKQPHLFLCFYSMAANCPSPLLGVTVHFSTHLIFPHLSWVQVACVRGQEDGGHEGCVPGFQVKHYQVPHEGPFQKGQALLKGQWKSPRLMGPFLLALLVIVQDDAQWSPLPPSRSQAFPGKRKLSRFHQWKHYVHWGWNRLLAAFFYGGHSDSLQTPSFSAANYFRNFLPIWWCLWLLSRDTGHIRLHLLVLAACADNSCWW